MNTEKTTMETVIEKLGPLISPELGKWLLDQEKREHQIWFNKGFEFYHEQMMAKKMLEK